MSDNDVQTACSAESDGKLFVVGIGASAGGIAPLLKFFNQTPADSGFAYVIILHLSADHESSLPGLIQSQTAIPVSQVTESIKVEPNHIYIIPPSKYLMLMDGMIQLTEPERLRGAHTSIDLFFRTLARAYGKNAIAILLSGTGADGTLGLGNVKEEGGFVIAQDLAEAEYPDMPHNAIASGRVDLVMPVAEMPAKLLALHDDGRQLQLPIEDEPGADFDEHSFRELLTMLRLRTGNDFSQYKRPTLLRRIARRTQVHGISELSDYLRFIRQNPDEIKALLQDLLITVTNFFRDREIFEHLALEVVPQLFATKNETEQVRVWSAGCATGEEAYSLAMLLLEGARRSGALHPIQVFATDIDERAIVEARECRYSASIDMDVSPERLQRFFFKDGDYYQATKELRTVVLFTPHNITRDPPFSRLDLISCRNLLIYLNRSIQERILKIFHFALRPGGFLLLGASESAEMVSDLFEPIDKKRRIYRRRLIMNGQAPIANPMSGRWQVKLPEAPNAQNTKSLTPSRLHWEVLEQLGPPSILINEDYEILHLSARAGQFLQMPGGEPSRNLLKLLDPAVRLDLQAALLEAKNRGENALPKSRRLRIEVGGAPRLINLTVLAVDATLVGARECFLIVFAETSEVESLSGDFHRAATDDPAVLRDLEQELQRTRDRLNVTIEQHNTSTEELRAANEELQAINEELRAASEELETSREELQSTNEELITINQEYREKLEVIGQVNSDLQNLMAATDIGTIFLDRALCIRRYTPNAQRVFNITPADIGRPFNHFTNKLTYSALNEDAEAVLQTLQARERQVMDTEHRPYQLRLAPYRTVDHKIDGVVLTLMDMTQRVESEETLRRQALTLREQTAALNLAYVMVLDADWRILLWNAGCERLYGFSSEEAVGQPLYELLQTEFAQSRESIIEQLQHTGRWEGEFVNTTKNGNALILASHLIFHRREPEQPPVILMVNNDVTASRLAEESLREEDRKKDRFLATLAHELRNPLAAMFNSTTILQQESADPRALELARNILHRQLTHLMRLVDDLLDVERLIHGKIKLDKRPIKLSEIFDAAVETCRQMIKEKKQSLSVLLPPEPLIIDGDVTRLSQIVANLLHNSVKYTPAGGEIDLAAEHLGSQVLIRVRDNGIGIEPEALSGIFEMYSQQTVSGENGQQGLGIGLSLVRELTELHGGDVSAASEGLGKGSEFTIRLPLNMTLSDGHLHGEMTENSDGPVGTTTKQVLLVEDNRDVADATAQVLSGNGHQVTVAYNATRALQLIDEFKPEIAILDIGLPEMDGYTLAKQIRSRWPHIILIALSGWRGDNQDPRAREAGFSHYFTKPLNPLKLSKLIAEI